MKKDKKAILISFVLGDGSITVDKRWGSNKAELGFCHSIHQAKYLEYKVKLLHSMVGGALPKIHSYLCKSNYGTFQQVRASKTHRYFMILRKWMYPNKYSIHILKHLTPHAIAIWYMDDGSIIANNRYKDGTCSSARTNIHLGTTAEIAKDVCNYFKERWDIKFTAYKEKGTYSIRCFHKEGEKFHKLIHPFIIDSMKYKQRFYYEHERIAPEMGDDIV